MKKIIAAFLILCFFMPCKSVFAYDGIKVKKNLEFGNGVSTYEPYTIAENYHKKQAEKIEKIAKKYGKNLYFSPESVYKESNIGTYITLKKLTLDKNGKVVPPVEYSCKRGLGEEVLNCNNEDAVKNIIIAISNINFDPFSQEMAELTNSITFGVDINIEQSEKTVDFETNTYTSLNEIYTNITSKIETEDRIYPIETIKKRITGILYFVYIIGGLYISSIYAAISNPSKVKKRIEQDIKAAEPQEVIYDDNMCTDFDKVIKYSEYAQKMQQNGKQYDINDDYTKLVKPVCKPYARYIKNFDNIATDHYIKLLKQKDMPVNAYAVITMNKNGTIRSIEQISCRGNQTLNFKQFNAQDTECKEVINILYDINIPKFSSDMESEYLMFNTNIVNNEGDKLFTSGVKSSMPMKFSIKERK